MTKNKVLKILNKSNNQDPVYAHVGDSGFDLRAWIQEPGGEYTIQLQPGETRLIHTGIYVQLPAGCEGQVRTRSGLALKQQLVVTNSPATIDFFYSGEVCVIMTNLSKEVREIINGDRIAQFVLCPVYSSQFVDLEVVDELEHQNNKMRGDKGFGSSGVK